MTDFTHAAEISELPEGTPVRVSIGREEIALVRQGNTVHAVSDACTHSEFSLSDGGHVEDGCIICSLHCGSFRLSDGEACDPPADDPIRVFEVRLDGDDVLVKV